MGQVTFSHKQIADILISFMIENYDTPFEQNNYTYDLDQKGMTIYIKEKDKEEDKGITIYTDNITNTKDGNNNDSN